MFRQKPGGGAPARSKPAETSPGQPALLRSFSTKSIQAVTAQPGHSPQIAQGRKVQKRSPGEMPGDESASMRGQLPGTKPDAGMPPTPTQPRPPLRQRGSATPLKLSTRRRATESTPGRSARMPIRMGFLL